MWLGACEDGFEQAGEARVQVVHPQCVVVGLALLGGVYDASFPQNTQVVGESAARGLFADITTGE